MDTGHAIPLWQAAFMGLFGLMYLTAGYRTVRFTARVASAILCMQGALLFSADMQHVWMQALVVAGAGIVGYLLGNAFYYVSVAFYGAVGGGVLAFLISLLATQHFSWAVVLGSAVAGLVLAVLLERPIVIAGTSLIGATLSVLAIKAAIVSRGMHADDRFAAAYIGAALALTVLGCVVQAKTTKNLPPPPSKSGTPPPPVVLKG